VNNMDKNSGDAALAGLNHLWFGPGSDVFDQLQHLDYPFVPSLGISDQHIYPVTKPAPGIKLCLSLNEIAFSQ